MIESIYIFCCEVNPFFYSICSPLFNLAPSPDLNTRMYDFIWAAAQRVLLEMVLHLYTENKWMYGQGIVCVCKTFMEQFIF